MLDTELTQEKRIQENIAYRQHGNIEGYPSVVKSFVDEKGKALGCY